MSSPAWKLKPKHVRSEISSVSSTKLIPRGVAWVQLIGDAFKPYFDHVAGGQLIQLPELLTLVLKSVCAVTETHKSWVSCRHTRKSYRVEPFAFRSQIHSSPGGSAQLTCSRVSASPFSRYSAAEVRLKISFASAPAIAYCTRATQVAVWAFATLRNG